MLGSLKELLPLLAANKVETFRCGELDITFQSRGEAGAEGLVSSPSTTAANPTPSERQVETLKTEGMVAPQSLDEEMAYDKILHWSCPVEEGPVPLTDDAPMTEAQLPEETRV